MSYSSAIARVNEIRDRTGDPTRISRVEDGAFDSVLANAVNRFDQGPARINTQTTRNNLEQNTNVVPMRMASLGGSASADLAKPSFSTPNKVNGWSPELKQMIDAASERFGVPRELVISVSRAESAFRSDAKSGAGATGLMQLMPGTAKGLGVTDINDPWQNLAGGTKYLRQLLDRFDGDAKKVIAGYNAGPNAVKQYGGVPPYPETQAYVARVLKYAGELGWQP